MNVLLSNSWFTPSGAGGGAERRAAQIAELARAAGFDLQPMQRRPAHEHSGRLWHGLRFLSRHRFPARWSLDAVRTCGGWYQVYRDAFRQHQGPRLLLWEATLYHGALAPYVAREFGFKVIALPHNLESFNVGIKDAFTGKGLPDSFESELCHLRQADAVMTIAREEQWLLGLRGVTADYLPYHPPSEAAEVLLKVRGDRAGRAPTRVLVLGSAIHPPTRLGMAESLRMLRPLAAKLGFGVDVAGFGTEALADELFDGATLHGPVGPEQLHRLLVAARANVVVQQVGMGALTRIPETLMAGVPVLANAIAARSWHGSDGLHVFANQAELGELLAGELPTPAVPPRPVAAEARFAALIRNLIGG